MADYGENLSGFNLGDKGGSSASTNELDAGMTKVQKRLAAMDAESAKKKEEEEKEIISTSERIETRKGDISALKSRKTIVEDITFSPDATADEKANAAAELKVIDKRIIEKEAEQKIVLPVPLMTSGV